MFYKIIRRSLLCSVIGLIYFNTASAEEMASAAMLSNTCLGCHGPAGISDGPATPTISGMSEVYIIGAMLAYKFGEDEEGKAEELIESDPDFEDVEYFPRVSSVMNRIAQGYSVEEIKLMAKHFAEVPFKAANQKDWKNKRSIYLKEYTFNPSKKTVNRLFKANRKLGLPWDADILKEHVVQWLPEIDLNSKVEIISKDEAIKQIQAAKKLLDEGILTEVEYEMISNRLKPIIID